VIAEPLPDCFRARTPAVVWLIMHSNEPLQLRNRR
jgi:hypothetical protein